MPYSPTIALLTRSALALCPAVIGYESLTPVCVQDSTIDSFSLSSFTITHTPLFSTSQGSSLPLSSVTQKPAAVSEAST